MFRASRSVRFGAWFVAGCLTAALAACGGGGEPVKGESAAPPETADDGTTTSAAPVPVEGPKAPLTGLPVAQPLTRPALVVKIDNDPRSRPQTGLNQADLVYEVRVEGITRFAAVFHSNDAEPVGPIRSARSSDIDLTSNLSRPLFAWSGGNPTVTNEILQGQAQGLLVNLSPDVAGDYRRDHSRPAPYNLYSSTSALWSHAAPDAVPPREVLAHRQGDDELPASAVAVPGVSVDYGSSPIPSVEFVWDASVGGWRRFQTDSSHAPDQSAYVDALGQQVAPPNVLVMFVDYTESVAGGGSPQAITVAEGDAAVLTDGKMIAAHWKRLNPNEPIQLTDPTGAEVKLTPGQTWVLLPEPGSASVLSQEHADLVMLHKR